MENEKIFIHIDGTEAKNIYQDILSLEVEFDLEMAGMFRFWLPLRLEDKKWPYLDDDRLRVWKKVAIRAGFGAPDQDLISGYITHVKPSFDPDPAKCLLEIQGLDRSVVMDREEKIKEWPNKKDSDIATEILQAHKFSPTVQDTQVVHDEKVSTIIQRETDMKFLNRLARRNGFECYVEGDKAYFGKPGADKPVQPELLCAAEEKTTLYKLSVEVNGTIPTGVDMFQVDPLNKTVLDTSVEKGDQKKLGKSGIDAFASGLPPSRMIVAMNTVTGQPEMQNLCQAMCNDSQWFVSAEGEINGNLYGHVLKIRQPVKIKGIGETYTGDYYVTHVTHGFSGNGYMVYFRAKRNALMS